MVAQQSNETAGTDLSSRVSLHLAVILIGAVSLAWHGMLPLNHDAAWIWEGAGRLLDGARYGRDVIDVNPPLAWWLTMLPAVLSRVTGLPASFSFTAFVTLLSAAGILVILGIISGRVPNKTAWIIGSVAAWALFLLPGYDFGQREHLMSALVLPYLGAAALRAENGAPSRGLGLTAGILAGLGFCLKPYFLLAAVPVEIWLWRRKNRTNFVRTETVAILAVGIAYLAAVRVFAPDYLDRVVPDAMLGYSAYGAATGTVALRLLLVSAPVLAGGGLVAFSKPNDERFLFAQCFAAASAGAVLSYLAQSKGWNYQMLPALVFASIAAGAAFPVQLRLPAIAGLSIILLFGSQGAIAQIADMDGTRARVAALSSSFRESPNGAVFAFITSPRDVHPAIVESDTMWTAPACCLYLLPASVEASHNGRTPHSRAILAAGMRQTQAVISMLIRKTPGIVAVDDGQTKLGFGTRRFDYLSYFLRDARFARFWREYREVRPIGNFRIFRLRTSR